MSARERAALLLAAAAAAAVYALAPSATYYGLDGIAFTLNLVRKDFVTPHPGYLPAGALVRWVTGATPEHSLRLVSAIGGAMLATGTYLGLRRLGHAQGSSGFASLLVALAPTTLLFSRHIELHAFHAGAAALAFSAFVRRNPRGGWAAWAAVTLASVMVTHATGTLSVPFLVWIGASSPRSRLGSWILRVVGPAVGLALAFLAACSLATPSTLAQTVPGVPGPVGVALLELHTHFHRADPVALTAYPVDSLLLASGLLLFLAIPGFLRLEARVPRLGLAVSTWVLTYLLLGALWGWVEEGGYLLPVYPALALGAAETASLVRSRLARAAPLARGAAATLLAFLVLAQGAVGVRRGVVPTRGPDPFHWLDALREETGDRGWFVTMILPHASLVQRYAGLRVVQPLLLAHRPPSEWEPLLENMATAIARESERGTRIYLDGDYPSEILGFPAFAGFLEAVRRKADLADASRGPLRAWRVLPRTP